MNPSRRRFRRSRRMGMRNRLGRFVRHANPSRRRTRSYRRHRNPTYRRAGKVYHTPVMTPALRALIGRRVREAMAARRSSGGSMVVSRRRSGGFRRRSGGGFGGGSLMSTFKGAISRPLLMKAGGAIAASLGTGYILNKWGSSLPLATNTYGKLIYTMGIPVAGAFLIRRKSRDLAEGMIIGGLVMSINSLISDFMTKAPAAAAPATVGAYSVAGELGMGYSAYPQSMRDTFALGGSNVAFPESAW